MLMRSAVFAATVMLSLSYAALAGSRPVNCKLIIDGKSYIDGVCEFSVTGDKKGSFSIYGDKYWAMVNVENDKGDAYWNEIPYATHAQAPLGEVRRNGGCWEGPNVRICAHALDAARLSATMAHRPKGLSLVPDHMDYLCVSAPSYRFDPGATLTMTECDHFTGARQQVFSLSGNVVSFEGKPDLCIDAQPLAGTERWKLVLNDCSHVAIRWIYDEHKRSPRSSNNLCWKVLPGERQGEGWSADLVALP